jgi:hypothetical protein
VDGSLARISGGGCGGDRMLVSGEVRVLVSLCMMTLASLDREPLLAPNLFVRVVEYQRECGCE